MSRLREKPCVWFVMLALLLIASWAGLRSVNYKAIWYDEWYSLYYAGAAPYYGPISITQTIQRTLQYNEYNPPGYYVALNLWGQVVGGSPFAGRTFSIWMGVIAIAVIFRLGSLLAGRVAGLASAVGLTASAFFIHQMTELRMYTVFPLLVTLTLLAYWQFIYGKAHWRVGLLFFVALLALLYTHYMALPLVIALALYHLIFAPKNRSWGIITALAVGCGLLYLPWIGVAFGALQTVSSEGSRNFYASDAMTLVNNVLTQFTNGAVPLLVIVGWFALRGSRRALVFVFGLLLGTSAVILLLNERLRFIGIARYLLSLWPLLALVVGLGITQMRRLKLYPLLLMVVWCVAGLGLILPRTSIPEPAETNWQVFLPWDRVYKVVSDSFFGSESDTDSLVFLVPESTPFWFHVPLVDYYLHPLRVAVDNMPAWLRLSPPELPLLRAHLVESQANITPDQYTSEAQQFLTDVNRVWLAYSPTYLPSPFVRPAWESTLVRQGFVACAPNEQDSTLRMDLYTRINQSTLTAHFGAGIQVGALDIAQTVDNRLAVLLGWSITADVPTNTYSIGVYVDDAQGQPIAQTDFGIPSQPTACSRTSISLTGLPAGTYGLSAVVYNWQTGERLEGQSLNSLIANRPKLTQFVYSPSSQ